MSAMRAHGQWPLVRAAVGGVAASVAGYLVAFLWVGGGFAGAVRGVPVRVRSFATASTVPDPTLLELVGAVPRTTLAAWVHANAHLVRVVEWSYPTTGATVPNLLLAGEPGRLLLFAVPPALLGLAGAILARGTTPGTYDELPLVRLALPAGAVRGTAVWVGYLPAAVLAAFVASAPTSNPSLAPFAPGLVGTVVLMGFVYPLVFGGLGGWLATRVVAARAPGEPDRSRPAG